jgi:hypothetical protein
VWGRENRSVMSKVQVFLDDIRSSSGVVWTCLYTIVGGSG